MWSSMSRPVLRPTCLAVALLCALPVRAAEPPAPRAACPSLRPCCEPGVEPCWNPHAARLLLGGASALGLAGGAAGFLVGGDSLGAGDPYAQAFGVGLVGLGGALLGSLVGLITPRGEIAVGDRPGRATLRLTGSPGGSDVVDEGAPWSLGLSFDPTLVGGDVFQVQPHVGLSASLGPATDLDPRPQLQAADPDREGTFPDTTPTTKLRVSAGAEFAFLLPYPLPKVPRPASLGRVEIRLRPRVEVRRRTLHSGGAQQVVEHTVLYPLLAGIRWHVSPRQRFTVLVGPRVDWIGFTDPGDTALRRGDPFLGDFYAEAWYQLDLPFTPRGGTKHAVAARLNLGYLHSKLDGRSFDLAQTVGFFGPVNLSVDLRVRRRGAPVALQITGGAWLNRGGLYFEVGLVAPDLHLPGGPS